MLFVKNNYAYILEEKYVKIQAVLVKAVINHRLSFDEMAVSSLP